MYTKNGRKRDNTVKIGRKDLSLISITVRGTRVHLSPGKRGWGGGRDNDNVLKANFLGAAFENGIQRRTQGLRSTNL
jgi:hypothetical protein